MKASIARLGVLKGIGSMVALWAGLVMSLASVGAIDVIDVEQNCAGDIVWSADEVSGEVGLRPVLETYRNQATEIWEIMRNKRTVVFFVGSVSSDNPLSGLASKETVSIFLEGLQGMTGGSVILRVTDISDSEVDDSSDGGSYYQTGGGDDSDQTGGGGDSYQTGGEGYYQTGGGDSYQTGGDSGTDDGDSGDSGESDADDGVLENGVILQPLSIVGDTNRDGKIDSTDFPNKEMYTTGEEGKGAIILANCDDDDDDDFPDNWPGNVDGWHTGKIRSYTGGSNFSDIEWKDLEDPSGDDRPDWLPEHGSEDTQYNGDYLVNTGDLTGSDIGRFRVRKIIAIPEPVKEIRLWVTVPNIRLTGGTSAPENEPDYFDDPLIKPENRVRIFLPSETDDKENLVLKEKDEEVVGPGCGYAAKFVEEPEPTSEKNEHDIDTFMGDSGFVEFGVEGIELGAMVEVWIATLDSIGSVITSDKIRVKVAPFIAASNLRPVDKVFTTTETSKVHPNFNSQFASSNAQNTEVISSKVTFSEDQFEIGYIQAPGRDGSGAGMVVALTLPKTGDLSTQLIKDGVGVFYKMNYLGWPLEHNPNGKPKSSTNYGGNIECSPPTEDYPHGRLIIGNASGQKGEYPNGEFEPLLLKFFQAQGVQEPFTVNLDFLDLRHIDALVSFVPSGEGFKVMIASPTKLLEEVAKIKVSEPDAIVHLQNSDNANVQAIVGTVSDWDDSIGEFEGMKDFHEAAEEKISNIRDQIITNLKVDESDFIEIPVLFRKNAHGLLAIGQGNVLNARVVGNNFISIGAGGLLVNKHPDTHEVFQGPVWWSQYFTKVKIKPTMAYKELNTLRLWESFSAWDAGAHCATNRIPRVIVDVEDGATDLWWEKEKKQEE